MSLLLQAIELHAPENWVSWGTLLFVAVCCLMLSAFVSGSEIAYFGLNDSEIETLEEEEDSQSKKSLYPPAQQRAVAGFNPHIQ